MRGGASSGGRVVVVGGGPAGGAVALVLARAGLAPVVLEAAPGPRLKVGECLPPSVNVLLERLGLSDAVARAGLPSHGTRFVWGSADVGERDFLFGAAGTGWQLDRRRFEEELAGVAVDAGVDWQYGRRLVACSRAERGGYRLEVKTERGRVFLGADLVIDASGRAATVARLLGVRRVRYDRLVGVAARFQRDVREGRQAADVSTLVEAVEGGWWYSAGLPGEKLVAAYLTDADLLDHVPTFAASGWDDLLEAAPRTRQRLHHVGHPTSTAPSVVRAETSRLAAVVGPGWLAVGDAAVAHDPLASHGITAALGSGAHAGAAAAAHLDGHRDALLEYASMLDRAFARYLVLHHDRYLGERRWSGSPFWRRRHVRTGPGAAVPQSDPRSRW